MYNKAMDQLSSPTAIHFLFLLLLLYLCSTPSYPLQVCNHHHQSALLAFSSNLSISSDLSSYPYSRQPPLNWSLEVSCCHWEGVYCDVLGNVTHLQLPYRGLKGLMSSSIGDLTALTHLNLSSNHLYGSLGEGIVRLTNLRRLDLSSNSLSGPVPQQIGNLIMYLESLNLAENKFSGPIPTSLMNSTNLVDLILRSNHLDGDISELDLSRLVHLQRLDLQNNSFNGTLPKSIYSCKSLVAIGVSQNKLVGQISPEIVQLKSLSFLSLASNSFTNVTGMLTILANCKNLTTLIIGENFYSESLPSDINFIGVGGFPSLEFLYLHGCDISGLLPEWVSTLKQLRVLNLNGNKFTGKIPNSIGSLPNLQSLFLSANQLSGEVPIELCRLPALLSPGIYAKLHHFQFEVSFYQDVLLQRRYHGSGGLGYYGHRIIAIPLLDISDNKLSGPIPWEMGNLQSLSALVLRENEFSGSIPATLSSLKYLEVLDLSDNELTGVIPTSLGNLSFLEYLDLSYNDLQGPVPYVGQFPTFDESSYQGNPGLCGLLTHRRCPDTEKSGAKGEFSLRGRPNKQSSFLDGLYVGLATGFSATLAIKALYVWVKIWKQTRPPPPRRW